MSDFEVKMHFRWGSSRPAEEVHTPQYLKGLLLKHSPDWRLGYIEGILVVKTATVTEAIVAVSGDYSCRFCVFGD